MLSQAFFFFESFTTTASPIDPHIQIREDSGRNILV